MIEKLPEGLTIRERGRFKEAHGVIDGHTVHYHFCTYCGGWIQGYPELKNVNTISPLSGRRGIVKRCVDCQQELYFDGIVS